MTDAEKIRNVLKKMQDRMKEAEEKSEAEELISECDKYYVPIIITVSPSSDTNYWTATNSTINVSQWQYSSDSTNVTYATTIGSYQDSSGIWRDVQTYWGEK